MFDVSDWYIVGRLKVFRRPVVYGFNCMIGDVVVLPNGLLRAV